MLVIDTKSQIIMRAGKPTAVILGIKKYKRLLEIAEEREDLLELRRIKKSKTVFRALNDYLGRV